MPIVAAQGAKSRRRPNDGERHRRSLPRADTGRLNAMSVMVEKVLQLIETMSRESNPVGVSQLGCELQINKSTVHWLLEILVRHGYAQ